MNSCVFRCTVSVWICFSLRNQTEFPSLPGGEEVRPMQNERSGGEAEAWRTGQPQEINSHRFNKGF